jgi:hypothetical protein
MYPASSLAERATYCNSSENRIGIGVAVGLGHYAIVTSYVGALSQYETSLSQVHKPGTQKKHLDPKFSNKSMIGGHNSKSCHSDQILSGRAEFPQLSAALAVSEAPRVHRRALRMASLTQDTKGNYKARKRLPDDVREEYGRLYGAHYEAKFPAPKTTKSH